VWRGDACVALCWPTACSCASPTPQSGILLALPRTRHAGERSPATTRSRRTWSCGPVAHRLAGATQASPRLVHTAPAPTRMPWAHRFLKRSHHQPTPESTAPGPTWVIRSWYQPSSIRRRSASLMEMAPVRSSSRIARRRASRSSRERGVEEAVPVEPAARSSAKGSSAFSYSICTR
jgi:hypothetical protein